MQGKSERKQRFIGEAALEAGTTVKAIHYYERVGLIPPAKRAGTYRVYDDSAIDRIRFIKCCQKAGFSLDEIRQVLPSFEAGQLSAARNIELIQQKRLAVEQQIATLVSKAESLSQLEHSLAFKQETQSRKVS